MPEEKELTEQEKFDLAEANAAEQIESLRFMQSEGSFIPNRFNASVLRAYLRQRGLSWTAENLTEAYRVCKDVLRDKDPEPKAPAESTPEPEPSRIVTDAERYGPWASLTKAQVKTMLRTNEYRKAMGDPHFVAKVNALEIKRGEL